MTMNNRPVEDPRRADFDAGALMVVENLVADLTAGVEWPMADDAAFRASVHTTILLTAALRDALELLRDLRDYPLADLERRQEEIDVVITVVEQALREG